MPGFLFNPPLAPKNIIFALIIFFTVTGVFRQKNPGNIFMLFIIGILLKLPAFFEGAPPIVKQLDSKTYRYIVSFFEPVSFIMPSIFAILAFLLVFFQTYLLTIFINNNRLMVKANFLPGMAYMLVTSLLPEFNRFSSPLIVSTLFILLFIILFSAHNEKITRGSIFNAGFILGLSGIIFLPSILFLLWVYIALSMLRPFKLNEWLVLLLGVLTPSYFLIIFLYLTDSFSWGYIYNGFMMALRPEKYTIWHAGALFLVLMPLLAGIYYIQVHSRRMLVHVRKAWNLFLIYTIIALAVTFFNVGTGIENWVLVLLPAAAIHGYGYFNSELKLYPKIAFWLSVAFIAAAPFFSNLWQ